MRVANVAGRLAVLTPVGAVDVATASEGRFDADPQDVYPVWEQFAAWAQRIDPSRAVPVDNAALGPPVPRPRQVFAVGLNYLDHAAESGLAPPTAPMIFTKFPSCITGPGGEIPVVGDTVDWEVELVVVIGRTASRVAASDAWRHVAGLTIGQDLSDRTLQMTGAPPQFSLAKSHPRFGPIGPHLVTPDELPDPNDLALECVVNGETVQSGRSSSMVFGVATLVEYLSGICTLHPGDLIFTGTPPGVGMGRTPPRYLRPGDVLETRIAGIGTMRHTMVSPG